MKINNNKNFKDLNESLIDESEDDEEWEIAQKMNMKLMQKPKANVKNNQ